MPRIALGVEYDGGAFSGWQRQHEQRSVQGCLEAALSRVADHPVEVVVAGRTDAGVHALDQVVHFDASVDRGERAWVLGTNSALPPQVSVQWARPVPDAFHARYSALSRSYRYTLLHRSARPALLRERVWWLHRQPCPARMSAAATALLGEHDFSAFRAAACQAKRPWRELKRIAIRRDGPFTHLEFTANAFLHHMVRNLVGTLVRIGSGDADVNWAARVLAGRDRRLAGMTAPPQGLALVRVAYPAALGLPDEACGNRRNPLS